MLITIRWNIGILYIVIVIIKMLHNLSMIPVTLQIQKIHITDQNSLVRKMVQKIQL